MKIYQVGGAVRDLILNKEPHDIDYVVVGATVDVFKFKYPDAKLVGKDFPVFLAKNKDGIKCEFSFARKERKVDSGHKGFTVEFSSDVTLEEDLFRRDLTINAIALNDDGTFIDPFNGIKDLYNDILNPVSSAYQEDPLRVYRSARFLSQLPYFKPSVKLIKYMRSMKKELSILSVERVWKEFEKSLNTNHVYMFLELLNMTNLLDVHFKELSEYKNIISYNAINRFALLVKDLDEDDILSLCKRLKAPKKFKKAGVLMSKLYNDITNIELLSNHKVLNTLLTSNRYPGGSKELFKCLCKMKFYNKYSSAVKLDKTNKVFTKSEVREIMLINFKKLKSEL